MALDKIIKKWIKKKKKQEYPGETLKKKNHEGEWGTYIKTYYSLIIVSYNLNIVVWCMNKQIDQQNKVQMRPNTHRIQYVTKITSQISGVKKYFLNEWWVNVEKTKLNPTSYNTQKINSEWTVDICKLKTWESVEYLLAFKVGKYFLLRNRCILSIKIRWH